jgi:hypothetical protein
MALASMQLYRTCFVALGLCAVVASCSKGPVRLVVEAPATDPKKRPDVSFGQRQIDQMLVDRPDMAGVLDEDDPVLVWIISGMNGERIGQRVYWNDDLPASGAPSEFLPPYEYYPPHICLWAGVETSPIDKWACLVFELFNLENTREFTDLQTKAMEGTLNGEAYARECANLEYNALIKARKFFDEHPLRKAKPEVDTHYGRFWDTPDTFEKYLAEYYDPDGTFHNPGEYFKEYYIKEIAPYVRKKPAAGE